MWKSVGKLAHEVIEGLCSLRQCRAVVLVYGLIANAGDSSGSLDMKTRELIAIAVAVTTRCDGCIAIHAKEALKHGASKQEIADALGVAISLNAGAALVYSARALDAIEAA
ncbi:carboxymuconolactone decarboxylase family protein [Parapusillimonas sp. JC17]|uniref:carboxymuconolactone decarboxylase family protein n=1 Tax=Parapusillimonas sp. JC17 TaxID=3445768 RepID=UPI003F9FF4D6